MANKIKVLHCVTAMNRGGLETFIMNYYRHIDRKKFSFDFLVQREGRFDYSDEIEKLGGRVYHIPAFNPIKIKKYNSAIDAFFAKHVGEYDIVHAHNNSFAMYILRAAKKYGYPVRISHSHIADAKSSLIRSCFVFYNKRILNKVCNARFACSKKAGEWLFGKNDFTVIKNAIDLKQFSFSQDVRDKYRNKLQIGEHGILLGNIGRFETQKNQAFLIDVLKNLRDSGVDAKLLLIGEGSLKKKIETCAEKSGVKDNVIFAGTVENPYDYLNAMDCFVFPSLFEGLGIVVIEAQANGLPCIVSDTVVRDCKATPLVKFLPISDNAPAKWTNAIVHNSTFDRNDYTELLTKAGYDIRVSAGTLEKEYYSLLDSNGASKHKEKICS